MDYVSSGTLYIVATPIGNMGDVTRRAIDVLKEATLILSEDTRETQKLLANLDLNKSQISYTDQKHNKVIDNILNELSQGGHVALVSDSGTPLISDPGFKLVRKVRQSGFNVVAIPGPSSPIAALSVSGLPTDKFTFLGFLPKSSKKRTDLLKEYGSNDVSLIIFESPKRVKKLLDEIYETLGNRTISLVKDLTKKFENVRFGKVEEINTLDIKEKGEYIVIIAKEGYNLNE